MTTITTVVCLVLALVVVVLAGLQAARDRPAARAELGAAALLELGVLVYAAVRVTSLATGHRPPSLVLVIVYLAAMVLVMPVAAALSLVERTRWGSVVLVVGALTVAVLFARVAQLWTAHG